ncbi:MAG: DUF721 domain-containing protein [Myxococcaceae bacterium]|nr:DUF721 domain-containing protein [Myxococcaceae bacterium]
MARSTPTAPTDLLGLVLGGIARGSASAAVLAPVWARVAGPTLAAVSSPARWQGATLVIRCASPAWAAELRRQPQLLVALEARLGSAAPDALAFES